MNRLIIMGAGGFGREVYCWLKQSADWNVKWQFAGFLDDKLSSLEGFGIVPGVLGKIKEFVPQPDDQLVCAIGDPRARLAICRRLAGMGANFPVIRHPFTVIGESCRIGAGSILCPGAIITTNVVLGAFVIANLYAIVGHDACIGDGVTLGPHSGVTGFARIEEGASLGSHASVLPSACVGSYARVGAGSIVLRVVKPGATVMGVPAKQIIP